MMPSPAVTNVSQELRLRSFLPGPSVCRAGQPIPIHAVIENSGDATANLDIQLGLPQFVRLVKSNLGASVSLQGGEEKTLTWEVEAKEAISSQLALRINQHGKPLTNASLPILFLAPVAISKSPYIPEPVPAPTQILVGAHHCPLWEADKFNLWDNVLKHAERTPALGFYAQESPEISDWETKWAVEHGISFFVYCWYRASQGGPVTMRYGSAIHDGLFKSRFQSKMKFTIMWENQNRGVAGVANEPDLMNNLLPFWLENYFKHPSYLKVDNKPLLFIYRPEFLVKDLGGVAQVRSALDKMRQTCKAAGFDGLYLLGEYRGTNPVPLQLMKQLGLDYSFAYCWYVPNSPSPAQAIETQMQYLRKTQDLGILPQVPTISQAWSGWRDEGSIWKIPPADFATLAQQAKNFITTLPTNQLGSRMLLLDNWNEWGEGHYLAPYREYGFGYLDAVRQVFASANPSHTDLLPEDIGMGPYDTAFRTHQATEDNLRRLLFKKVRKAGATEDGLVGWWAFDEETNAPVTLDYSGNRIGATLHGCDRAAGIDGRALVCNGGWVLVGNHTSLSLTSTLTLECWVKTEVAGQDNKWFINRVYGGGAASGYRLGILQGKPCFEVPLTNFSHHLTASIPLPTGRWVHLVGTFDGQTMRLYVDGQERGAMARPGPMKPNAFPICMGNYAENHSAHFTGLLDEVKLYCRALSPEEIQTHYRALADKAGP
ncbi:MAG: LamG-like jellyroll fold domain-containing protein [Verrucomicrobiota bacterium]